MDTRKTFLVAGTVFVAGLTGSLQDRDSWEGYCEPRPVALCPGNLIAKPQTGGGQPPELRRSVVMATTTSSSAMDFIKQM